LRKDVPDFSQRHDADAATGAAFLESRFRRAFVAPTHLYLFIYQRRVFAHTRTHESRSYMCVTAPLLFPPSPISFPPYYVMHNEASNRARYAQSRRRRLGLEGYAEDRSKGDSKKKKEGEEKRLLKPV